MYVPLNQRKRKIMLSNVPSHLHDLPIYRKAMDIFTLSRSISDYFHYDLSHLKEDGTEQTDVYFSGDIVQQSVSLGPEIAKAEENRYSERKHKHLASLSRLTNLLYRNSYRLENSTSNGRDYMPILRREIRKFRKLQRNWMLTL